MNIKELWNSQADHQNQWDSLGEDEKLEFAMAHEREECAKLFESIQQDNTSLGGIHFLLHDTAKVIRARSKA